MNSLRVDLEHPEVSGALYFALHDEYGKTLDDEGLSRTIHVP